MPAAASTPTARWPAPGRPWRRPASAVHRWGGSARAAAGAGIAMGRAVEPADPDAAFGPFTPLLILEQIGLTGARIGSFYNRVCGGDVVTALAVLHATRLQL